MRKRDDDLFIAGVISNRSTQPHLRLAPAVVDHLHRFPFNALGEPRPNGLEDSLLDREPPRKRQRRINLRKTVFYLPGCEYTVGETFTVTIYCHFYPLNFNQVDAYGFNHMVTE